MRFLGHHDLVRTFQRAFRRAEIKLAYSKGFHPHPRLRFSPPLSLGVESVAEYLDFDLVGCNGNTATIRSALAENLPAGVVVMDLEEIPLSEPPVSAKIQQVSYEIGSFGSLSPEEVSARIKKFHSVQTFPIEIRRKGKARRVDVKASVEDVVLSESRVTVLLKSGPSGSLNPLDVVGAILGRSREEVRSMSITKRAVRFAGPSSGTEADPHDE
jgi:radical SAM-linked protein